MPPQSRGGALEIWHAPIAGTRRREAGLCARACEPVAGQTGLEKDHDEPPRSGEEAWQAWQRAGVSQFRQLQAVMLRDALRSCSADPAELAESYDHMTGEHLTPWYRDQVNQDRQRAASLLATAQGRPRTGPATTRR
jgi:hypothetical protein